MIICNYPTAIRYNSDRQAVVRLPHCGSHATAAWYHGYRGLVVPG